MINIYHTGSVYLITNTINGKKYVGKTVIKPKYRWSQHKVNSKANRKEHKNCALYKAMRKYGIENFTFSIIEECKVEYLPIQEQFYINKYTSFGTNGYNMTSGGEGTIGIKRPKSKKWRKSHSKIMKGKNNPMFGTKFTQERRLKHSEIMREYYKNNPVKSSSTRCI